MREINKAGLDLIKSFESLRLHAYDDGVGVMTIGYGHTRGVKRGDVITRQQADEFLRDDLKDAIGDVLDAVKVPLSNNQFAALVSLAFNIGGRAFAGSSLVKRLNAKDYSGAADRFRLWNKGKVKGKLQEMRGLTRRRAAERDLFNTPDSTSLVQVPATTTPEHATPPLPEDSKDNEGAVKTQDAAPSPTGPEKSGEPAPDTPAKPGEAIVGGRPEDAPKQASQGGLKSLWATISGAGVTTGMAVVAWFKDNSNAAVVLIICATVLILVFMFRQIIMDYLRIKMGAMPDRYNVK